MASTDYIDLSQLDDAMKDLDKMAVKMADGKAALRRFWEWWKLRRLMRWSQIKATGGAFFGEYWPPMKPQYTREDGTEVPAWGGAPRVAKGWGLKRRGGNVKGKKRPSGARVKQSSVMMQDTGNMRNSIMQQPLSLTKDRLGVGPKGVGEEYADDQDANRPVCFWEQPRDAERAVYEFLIEVGKAAKEFANG